MKGLFYRRVCATRPDPGTHSYSRLLLCCSDACFLSPPLCCCAKNIAGGSNALHRGAWQLSPTQLGYFKFTCVRDPLDRFVSNFNFLSVFHAAELKEDREGSKYVASSHSVWMMMDCTRLTCMPARIRGSSHLGGIAVHPTSAVLPGAVQQPTLIACFVSVPCRPELIYTGRD